MTGYRPLPGPGTEVAVTAQRLADSDKQGLGHIEHAMLATRDSALAPRLRVSLSNPAAPGRGVPAPCILPQRLRWHTERSHPGRPSRRRPSSPATGYCQLALIKSPVSAGSLWMAPTIMNQVVGCTAGGLGVSSLPMVARSALAESRAKAGSDHTVWRFAGGLGNP